MISRPKTCFQETSQLFFLGCIEFDSVSTNVANKTTKFAESSSTIIWVIFTEQTQRFITRTNCSVKQEDKSRIDVTSYRRNIVSR